MDQDKVIFNQNPIEKANFFSILLFTYTLQIFKRGREHFWNKTNLYDPLDSHRCIILGERIERLWLHHSEQCKLKGNKLSIEKVLFQMFWPDLLKDSFFLILSLVPRILQPILLGNFLSYFSTTAKITENETYWYIFFFTVVNGMVTVFSVQYKFSCSITALKIRISCASLLFRKVLRMRTTELQGRRKGDTLNMISNELSRFDQTSTYVHYLWASPLFTISILYLLYFDAGISGLVGVLWYILYMFLQSHAARLTGSYRNKIAEETSKRIKLMNEILSVIGFIKIYAWEGPFCDLVKAARKLELTVIRKVTYLKGIFHALLSFSNSMAIFFGMLTMVLLKEDITVPKVFNLVLYYNTFNFVITLMFPFSIIKATELHQILKRVNDFMGTEEMVEKEIREGNPEKVAIMMKNIDVRWDSRDIKKSHHLRARSKSDEANLLRERMGETILRNINISLEKHTFLGIIGPVGSGKTTLLLTVLEETFTSGYLRVYGSISYASQEPWIFPGTLKQNIIFNQPFDKARYSEVIRVCGLDKDFYDFPESDMTQVGEHGTSLSGGQRTRIDLARAVYREADIYLLDDTLSSVDISVGKYILDECINGFLKQKVRILVTHNIEHLQLCDKILHLNSGQIENEGTFGTMNIGKKNCTDSLREHEISTKILLVPKPRETFGNHSSTAMGKHLSLQLFSKSNGENSVLLWYLTGGNNLCGLVFVVFVFIFTQLVEMFVFFLVSYWAYSEEAGNESLHLKLATFTYVNIFMIVLITLVVCSLVKAILYAKLALRNSERIHDNVLRKVINSQMSFFHVTDSGKILTRFSKDIGIVDEILPRTLMESFVVMLGLCAKMLLIFFVNPYVILIAIPLSLILMYFTKVFVCTSKNIKRIEGSLMEPVLTRVNATIQGLPTIRATRAQNTIKTEFHRHQDQCTSSCFMFYTVTHAFSFAVEFISFLFTSLITISCFLIKEEISSNVSEIGLAITQSMTFTTYLQFCIIQCVQANNNLVAVERILQFEKLPQEPIISPGEEISGKWPEEGRIQFEYVEVRHQDHLPTVLHNLNFIIEAREKIGIIGRTGAGKSSIFAAILRTACVSGTIKIDTYDTKDIPLNTLRSRIGVITQDPVLFSGTLRYNLDPFQQFDDHILYAALREVNFDEMSTNLRDLDDKIFEGGSNLSLGQRQLICLARIIIRKNKIILLDEATSNVDLATESFIQKTIATKFVECTVITIAHRLRTVKKSDRIMIIQSGRILHFDQPEKLLQDVHDDLSDMLIGEK